MWGGPELMTGTPQGCGCFPSGETDLHGFRWWRARLNYRQDYPGKVLLALGRHEEDLLAVRPSEQQELWEAVLAVRDAVNRVFAPDWWNYMFLGNQIRHVHLHLIPRYAKPRVIHGWEFRDRHWGGLHARQEEPTREVFEWILQAVKAALRKAGRPSSQSSRFDETDFVVEEVGGTNLGGGLDS